MMEQLARRDLEDITERIDLLEGDHPAVALNQAPSRLDRQPPSRPEGELVGIQPAGLEQLGDQGLNHVTKLARKHRHCQIGQTYYVRGTRVLSVIHQRRRMVDCITPR